MRDIGLSEVVCMIVCVFKFLCIFLGGECEIQYFSELQRGGCGVLTEGHLSHMTRTGHRTCQWEITIDTGKVRSTEAGSFWEVGNATKLLSTWVLCHL